MINNTFEGCLLCDRVSEDNPGRVTEERLCDRSEAFLASTVPNLQLDPLPADLHGPRLEVNPEGGDVSVAENIVSVSHEESALSHSRVAHDEELECFYAVFVVRHVLFFYSGAKEVITCY